MTDYKKKIDDIITTAKTAAKTAADEVKLIKQELPKATTDWYNKIVQNDVVDTRTKVNELIDYLDKNIYSIEDKDEKNQNIIVLNVLKQLNSGSYFYNFERLFDLFPTTDAVKTNKKEKPDFIENKGVYKTYMYALPKDFKKEDYDTEIKKKDPQKGQDYGISYRVFHEDKKMHNFSSILGVEYMLDVLNKTGSNVNYLNDYFFKDNKPDPVYINAEVEYDKIRNYYLKPTKKET